MVCVTPVQVKWPGCLDLRIPYPLMCGCTRWTYLISSNKNSMDVGVERGVQTSRPVDNSAPNYSVRLPDQSARLLETTRPIENTIKSDIWQKYSCL